MKKILLLFLLLVPGYSLMACVCVEHGSAGQFYATSDFVGIVEIDSVNKTTAYLKTSTIYKGR